MFNRYWIMIPALILFMFVVSFPLISSAPAAAGTYPRDLWLQSQENKTALIVVAHDDDAVSCAGTVCKLIKEGWKVHFLCFYGNWRKEDNPVRKRELENVKSIQGLTSLILIDVPIQKTDTVKEPWMPVAYDKFTYYFRTDTLQMLISEQIKLLNPVVVFTLDDVTGGYGHPEHVCVSRCVNQVCVENTSVKRIYQAVFTPSQANKVMKDMPVYAAAKQVYQVSGMPEPDVEIDILDFGKQKSRIMQAFESQKRNLKKIWPGYNLYPSWFYWRRNRMEYFRVIEVNQKGS